jgi:hypothetical protein
MNDELTIERRAGSHRSNHGIQHFENDDRRTSGLLRWLHPGTTRRKGLDQILTGQQNFVGTATAALLVEALGR